MEIYVFLIIIFFPFCVSFVDVFTVIKRKFKYDKLLLNWCNWNLKSTVSTVVINPVSQKKIYERMKTQVNYVINVFIPPSVKVVANHMGNYPGR